METTTAALDMLSGKHYIGGMETTLVCRNDACPAHDAENESRERWTITVYRELSTGYCGPKDDDEALCPSCGEPGESN